MSEPVRHHKTMLSGLMLSGLAILLALVSSATAQVLEPLRDPTRLEPRSVQPVERPIAAVVDTPSNPAPSENDDVRSVHLASYYTFEDAAYGWDVLLEQFGDVLGSYEPVFAEVDLQDRGVFVRLLAGPLPGPTEALELCDVLQGAGAYCIPADAAGEFLLPTGRFEE